MGRLGRRQPQPRPARRRRRQKNERWTLKAGWKSAPDRTTRLVSAGFDMTSGFECSDPMVNRLFKNIVWTQRANFIDLPTDCPPRDERFGWTGDAQIYAGAATYNADVAAFYGKWLRELRQSQRPSGVRVLRTEGDRVALAADSGTYRFATGGSR